MEYATTRDHLLDELDRIETVIDGLVAALDGEQPSTGEPAPDEETALDPSSLPLAVPDPYHERATGQAADIRQRKSETSDDVLLRLGILADRFDLSRRHLDVLVLALAPDLDRSIKGTYRRLYDTNAVTRPTVGLLTDLFATTDAERFAATELVSSGSPLREHGLLVVVDPERPDATALDAELRMTEHVRSYLQGHDGLDPALDDVASLRTPSTDVGDLRLDDDLLDRIEALDRDADAPARYYFHGPAGCQKAEAVDALADGTVLRAELPAVLEAGALDRLQREARLQDCPLHLTDAGPVDDDPTAPALEAVFDAVADLDVDVFVTGTDAWTPTGSMATALDAIVAFPFPSIDLRREFWTAHADELPADVDPDVLAGTFRLTQGELDAALSTARSLADGDLTADAVYEGCAAQSADGLADLAQRVEPSSSWDDIQLREKTMRKLRIVRDHVRHQARIYGDWGFAEAFSRGTGVVALFSGASGTGKTMAAEILANDVGMDCYKIDLSSVVSKYIGETEENLEEIFEAAENSNAILLFDEADAVFGDRADVSDATDRYANVEVNYLLQRIETYDGVVLLTTNNKSNIDSAFQRRIDHTVPFSRPDEETRDAIWRNIFPAEAPLGEIDFDHLGEFEFTGGQIRTIGQTAAILAAGDDADRIGMKHVVRAIQLAAENSGKVLDSPAFGEYQQLRYTNETTAGGPGDARDSTDAEAKQMDDPEATSEDVLRAYFENLDAGDGDAAHALYHSRAVAEPFSYKQLVTMREGDLSIVGEFERVRDDRERVVVRLTQDLNGTRDQLDYELRREDGSWRIFDYERARPSTIVDG